MNYMEREKKSGIQRLIDVRENIDQRASLILTYHAALECETDRLLAKLLPRANKLRGLGFGQKISVLDAAWPGQPALAEVLFSALVQFNDLRNAVAHGDSKREVDRIISKIERHLGSNLPTAR